VFLVVGICWGWFTALSLAMSLGLMAPPIFNDTKFIHLLSYELVAGLLAIYLLRRRGWKLQVSALQVNWITTGAGLLILLLATLLYWIVYAVGVGFGDSNEALRDITRSISVSWPLAIVASVVNGAYEEFLLVGFIFKALERYDLKIIIGVSVFLRVIAHVYQGPVGALGIFTLGILYALVYARYRKIWTLIVAHTGADILAFVR
jgi:membrane protease YdiL (CAAX protease family)